MDGYPTVYWSSFDPYLQDSLVMGLARENLHYSVKDSGNPKEEQWKRFMFSIENHLEMLIFRRKADRLPLEQDCLNEV